MKVLNGWDAVSGKEGRAYAKIDGNNEELFYAKTIEAKVEKTKSQVKSIGRRMVGHKTTGAEGTGSMTIYYITPLFRAKLAEWKATGRDAYFDLVIENDDPDWRGSTWTPPYWPSWTATPTTPWKRRPTLPLRIGTS